MELCDTALTVLQRFILAPVQWVYEEKTHERLVWVYQWARCGTDFRGRYNAHVRPGAD